MLPVLVPDDACSHSGEASVVPANRSRRVGTPLSPSLMLLILYPLQELLLLLLSQLPMLLLMVLLLLLLKLLMLLLV